MRMLVLAILAASLAAGGLGDEANNKCTPAYFELDEAVRVSVGASVLSFRMLAIGCKEDLGSVWPPPRDSIERALLPELKEPHPVQILMMIRDRSPDLRKRLVIQLNSIIDNAVVHDVFIFDAKAAEH